MPASGISRNTKSPPNNIVVAQRAFLCLLLLTNNQSPGPGALKWKTFFDRQLADPVRSVSFIQPVGNSIKTVSEHLPCVLEPSVYAGLRDFANYSYSMLRSFILNICVWFCVLSFLQFPDFPLLMDCLTVCCQNVVTPWCLRRSISLIPSLYTIITGINAIMSCAQHSIVYNITELFVIFLFSCTFFNKDYSIGSSILSCSANWNPVYF